MNDKEKNEYVKEGTINEEWAMNLCIEYGQTTWQVESGWLDGEKFEADETGTELATNTEMKSVNETCQDLEQEDAVSHKAVGVWTR